MIKVFAFIGALFVICVIVWIIARVCTMILTTEMKQNQMDVFFESIKFNPINHHSTVITHQRDILKIHDRLDKLEGK